MNKQSFSPIITVLFVAFAILFAGYAIVAGASRLAATFTAAPADPVLHESNIPLTHTLTITFSEELDLTSLSTQTLMLHGEMGGLDWNFAYANQTLVVTPSRPFFPGEQIYLIGTDGLSSTINSSLLPLQTHFSAGTTQPLYCGVTLTPQAQKMRGMNYSSTDWGDYDNDLDLDLLVTGKAGGIDLSLIYRNDGGGLFTAVDVGLTQLNDGSAVWGDSDNDGDLDILITGLNFSLTPTRWTEVYRNNGDGSFTLTPNNLPGINDGNADWGDFDNDGDLDIAIIGLSNSFASIAQVYRNNGNDSYSLFQNLSYPMQLGEIKWGDLDGDNDLDLVASGYDTSFAGRTISYINDNNVDFAEGPRHDWLYYSHIDLGDYDNDLDLDFVVNGYSSATFTRITKLFANDGLGNFTEVITANLPVVDNGDLAFGDYDNDLDLDLFITGFGLNPPRIYENLGGDVFTTTQLADQFPYLQYGGVAWDDIDNDGDLDLAVNGNNYQDVYLFEAGAYQKVDIGLTAVAGSDADWADYDNDGLLDLLIIGLDPNSNPSATVYHNDGNNKFRNIDAPLQGVYLGSSDWGDYDNDGDMDILMAGTPNGSIRYSKIYRNDNGVFTDTLAALPGMQNSATVWGDYDNDGDLDFYLSGFHSAGYFSSLYRNDNGVFITDTLSSLVQIGRGAASFADYDNDGDLDLAVTGYNGTYHARIYRNDGGIFTDSLIALTGFSYSSLEWGDYDNDLDLDLLLSGHDGSTSRGLIYRNDGGDIFTDISAGLTSGFFSDSEWGDYDNDGDLDVVVGSSFDSSIYRNDGNDTFVKTPIDIFDVSDGSGNWGDYDNDGDLDLLITGSGSAIIYQFEGFCFAAPDSYSTNEDQPLMVGLPTAVLTNDIQGPFTATVLLPPSNGVTLLNPDGTFSYTPTLNYYGIDSFVYQTGPGNALTATVTITISSVDDGPTVAVGESYTTTVDTPLTILAPGLLINDNNPDDDGLAAVFVSSLGNGTVDSFPGTGAFTYTPNPGFVGTDLINYYATGGGENSDPVNVIIQVLDQPNSAPLAVDDLYTSVEDKALVVNAPTAVAPFSKEHDLQSIEIVTSSITLLDNDSDPEGNSLTTWELSEPMSGTVNLNVAGEFIYLPDPGAWGVDSFVYVLSDGQLTTTAIVTINIIPVAEAPLLMIADGAGDDGDLDWTIDSSNCNYEIHQSTTPYFTPAGGTLLTTVGAGTAVYTAANSTGNPAVNYYFILKAKGCAADEADSNEVGEFDFTIVPGD